MLEQFFAENWLKEFSECCIFIYISSSQEWKTRILWWYKTLTIWKNAFNQKVDGNIETVWNCVHPKNCQQNSKKSFRVRYLIVKVGIKRKDVLLGQRLRNSEQSRFARNVWSELIGANYFYVVQDKRTSIGRTNSLLPTNSLSWQISLNYVLSSDLSSQQQKIPKRLWIGIFVLWL